MLFYIVYMVFARFLCCYYSYLSYSMLFIATSPSILHVRVAKRLSSVWKMVG